MRLFLDSANLAEVQWAQSLGIVDGVTTNPSLLARELPDGDHRAHLTAIARMVRGPVTAQVMAVDAEGIYREAKELARLADNIVPEIPIIEEGLVATRRLSIEGVRVDMTLVFSAAQALLAAKAGAAFVSPHLGRLDDIGADGAAVVADARTIFDRFSLDCEIIASSIRHPRRFADAARLGADAVTAPPDVLRALLLHPLTDVGLDQFLSDWSKRHTKPRPGL